MIDELLGRAELKARIDELEAELDELQEENDRLKQDRKTAERKRREAVRKRQDAQEKINRLEDRIAQLEGDVERLSDNERELSFRDTDRLRISETSTLIEQLQNFEGPPETVLTAAIDDEPAMRTSRAFGQEGGLLGRAAPCIAITDTRGLLKVALRPPLFPDPFTEWAARPQVERSWFVPTGTFTLALVRSDLFAMGVYEGDTRTEFEGFESEVMGEHSKGGFSQARFERRRDEQITNHIDRVTETLKEATTEPLYLVGEQTVLDELSIEAAATDTVDATGDPEEALTDAFEEFWTTRLYIL